MQTKAIAKSDCVKPPSLVMGALLCSVAMVVLHDFDFDR